MLGYRIPVGLVLSVSCLVACEGGMTQNIRSQKSGGQESGASLTNMEAPAAGEDPAPDGDGAGGTEPDCDTASLSLEGDKPVPKPCGRRELRPDRNDLAYCVLGDQSTLVAWIENSYYGSADLVYCLKAPRGSEPIRLGTAVFACPNGQCYSFDFGGIDCSIPDKTPIYDAINAACGTNTRIRTLQP